GDNVEHAIALLGEDLHLLPESPRPDGQLVAVVGDAVVEEDPQLPRPRAVRRRVQQPDDRATPSQAGLQRIYEPRPGAQRLAWAPAAAQRRREQRHEVRAVDTVVAHLRAPGRPS